MGAKKEGIFALCALVLHSALLAPPGVWAANRLRPRFSGSQARPNGWLTGSALSASAFTALAGLLFMAAITLYPVLLYQDALALNANLGLDARLMMSLPLGLGVGALLLVTLSIALWKRGVWSVPHWLHFTIVTLAVVVLSLMLFGWNIIPFGF